MPKSITFNRVVLAGVAVILLCAGAYLKETLLQARFALGSYAAHARIVLLPSAGLAPQPSETPTLHPSFTVWPSTTSTPAQKPTEMPTLVPSATATLSPTPTFTLTLAPTPSATATALPTPVPLPTPDGTLRMLRVPILMYHHISVPPPGSDAIRQDLSVSPASLEEHLRYLRNQGYTSITLSDLLLALETGASLPPKPIVLTFDDGYSDNYTYAFPLLQKYDYTAAFFVNVAFIDNEYPEYVTWDQLQEMAAAGMDIEAHGYTHPDLRNVDLDTLIFQVLRPKEAIEARTQKTVRFFCYPSGAYNEQVIRVLQSAHYWGGVTLVPGVEQSSDRPFEWQRIRVRGQYSVQDLDRILGFYMAE